MKKDMRKSNGQKVSLRLYWSCRAVTMIVPAVLMLVHWCAVAWVHGMAEPDVAMPGCGVQGAALYAAAYVALPAVMLPWSYFFGLHAVWRVPFVYVAGVNAARAWHGGALMTQATAATDWTLIAATAAVYAAMAVWRCARKNAKL